METQVYLGFAQIFQFAQLFVLGPRLILSIREYHANHLGTDTATTTPIAFQEYTSTSSSV
jgi:hypothetical protein